MAFKIFAILYWIWSMVAIGLFIASFCMHTSISSLVMSIVGIFLVIGIFITDQD